MGSIARSRLVGLRRPVLISQMGCGLLDAGIDGRSVDINSVELSENMRLFSNRNATDLNTLLSGVGQCGLMTEK